MLTQPDRQAHGDPISYRTEQAGVPIHDYDIDKPGRNRGETSDGQPDSALEWHLVPEAEQSSNELPSDSFGHQTSHPGVEPIP